MENLNHKLPENQKLLSRNSVGSGFKNFWKIYQLLFGNEVPNNFPKVPQEIFRSKTFLMFYFYFNFFFRRSKISETTLGKLKSKTGKKSKPGSKSSVETVFKNFWKVYQLLFGNEVPNNFPKVPHVNFYLDFWKV